MTIQGAANSSRHLARRDPRGPGGSRVSALSGRQEGQFDIGLVNRWDHLEAGLFSSFNTSGWAIRERRQHGAGRFPPGLSVQPRPVGFYGTEGFKNTGALTELRWA